MATVKVKVLKSGERKAELKEAFKQTDLRKLFLTANGKPRVGSVKKIVNFLKQIGRNIKSISSEGDIVWINKKDGKKPQAKKIQKDLKELISENVKVKLSKAGKEQNIVDAIRGFSGVEGQANIELRKEEEMKAEGEKVERQKQKTEQTNKAKAKITSEAKVKEKAEQTQKAKANLKQSIITKQISEQTSEQLRQKVEEAKNELEEVKIELEIVKIGEDIIEDGAEQAEEAVSARDKKQDSLDVANVELGQVASEQPITQEPVDVKLQEEQLAVNVNVGAEGIVNVGLVFQNEEADQQLNQEQQVEPVEVVVDDVAQIAINEVKIEIEREEPVITNESLRQSKELHLIKKQSIINDLFALSDFLGKLLQVSKKDPYPIDVLDEIVRLRQKLKDVKARRRVKSEDDKNINTLLKEIQRKLKDGSTRLDLIQRRENEILAEGFVRQTVQLQEKLEKTKKAIAEIKKSLDNDGLVMLDFPVPESKDAGLIQNAIGELSDELLLRGGMSNEVMDLIANLFNIVSFDTQQVLRDVLTNTIAEGDMAQLAFIPTRTLSSLFLRFVSRLLYAGEPLSDEEGDANVEAFIQGGIRLQGRNETIVNKLLSALKLIIPVPPALPRTLPETSTGIQTLRRRLARLPIRAEAAEFPTTSQTSRDSLSDFLKSMEDELKRDLENVEEQPEGTFRGLFDSFTSQTASMVEESGTAITTRNMTDEEFEEQQEEIEDLEASYGKIAQGLAVSVASAATLRERLAGFAEAVALKAPDIPIIPQAVRNSFANNPNRIPRILRNIARDTAPEFRNRGGARGIGIGRLVRILKSILLTGLIGAYTARIFEEEQPEQQPEQPDQRTDQRQGEETTPAKKGGDTTEFFKSKETPVPVKDTDKPVGVGLLRADFNMLGIDYFNEKFAVTPVDKENSEWAEFDYVKNVDIQNNIEKDNTFAQSVRFQEPMFLPKYQEKIKPPSQLAVNMGRNVMTPQIQLSQGFAPKFSGAVSVYDNLSFNVNQDAFSRSWKDNILYHPDSSIL